MFGMFGHVWHVRTCLACSDMSGMFGHVWHVRTCLACSDMFGMFGHVCPPTPENLRRKRRNPAKSSTDGTEKRKNGPGGLSRQSVPVRVIRAIRGSHILC